MTVVRGPSAPGSPGAEGPACAARRPTIAEEPFGHVDGRPVSRFTLASPAGVTVRILTYGGIVQSVHVPGADGVPTNVALGFATLDDYVAHNGAVYFGALIGRYANRIANGAFVLDGTAYRVPVNDNGNALHGGPDGFDRKIWTPAVESGPDSVSLRLRYVSPDGEMGFPGALSTQATYTLHASGRLTLAFHATTDRPTVVNLTNHAYWNLAGESSGAVYDHQLYLNAHRYTPVDPTQIPTGAVLPVAGTPLDFSRPVAIGARIAEADPQLLIGRGYDLNWVLDGGAGPADPLDSVGAAGSARSSHGASVLAARVHDPRSGRTLTIRTTQPGIQFYSGNFLTGGLVGTGGTAYRQGQGFALEPQHYPDSPNQPAFPGTVLRPGEVYEQTIVYEISYETPAGRS